eukprot:1933758-Pleurochrysis_carterae.AAC.1
MTTIPSVAKSSDPSQRAHTPRVRFSGMAVSRRRPLVSARQIRKARSARSTPTIESKFVDYARGAAPLGRPRSRA